MAYSKVGAAEKLRGLNIRAARARIALRDIIEYSKEPHIKALAKTALDALDNPVDNTVGPKS